MKYSTLDHEIEKLAQEFGLMGKLRESINLGGNWIEITSPEFKSMMKELRNVDDNLRNLVTGKNTDHDSLKNILKNTETDIKRREYAAALGKMVEFYDIIEKSKKELESLSLDFVSAHYQLLGSELSEGARENVFGLKKRMAAGQNDLIKNAGLLDTLHNIFSGRGRALGAWEKRFPRHAQKLKSAISSLLRISVSINNSIVSSLKQMGEFRIKRQIEDYLQEKDRLLRRMENDNTSFKQYYNSQVKEIVDKMEEALMGGAAAPAPAVAPAVAPAAPAVAPAVAPAAPAVAPAAPAVAPAAAAPAAAAPATPAAAQQAQQAPLTGFVAPPPAAGFVAPPPAAGFVAPPPIAPAVQQAPAGDPRIFIPNPNQTTLNQQLKIV